LGGQTADDGELAGCHAVRKIELVVARRKGDTLGSKAKRVRAL
jgi:hypothetical protein